VNARDACGVSVASALCRWRTRRGDDGAMSALRSFRGRGKMRGPRVRPHVGFTPGSRHQSGSSACPLCYRTYRSMLLYVRRWRDTSRTRRRPRPRRPPRRRAAAMRNRIPLNQKRLCVDLVHEDEWELDGTVRILSHRQPLRAGFAERTLATSSTIIRTYGGCRPCHGSSKLRSRNAQPKPPP
jgi:hypothetical protein